MEPLARYHACEIHRVVPNGLFDWEPIEVVAHPRRLFSRSSLGSNNMTSLAGPNWLAVTGSIFGLIGFGLLALGLASGVRHMGPDARANAKRGASSFVIMAAGVIAGGLGLAMQFFSQLGVGTGDAATPLAVLGLIPLILGAAVGSDRAGERAAEQEVPSAVLPQDVTARVPQYNPGYQQAATGTNGFRPMPTGTEPQVVRLHPHAAE
jgi:hypothetical protein